MMFVHDCTVWREETGGWKRYVLLGVLWQDVSAVKQEKSGWKDANTVEVFIPHALGFKIRKKDLLLKGVVDYEIQKKPSELYALGEVRTVTMVDSYDFGGLKHDKAGGR